MLALGNCNGKDAASDPEGKTKGADDKSKLKANFSFFAVGVDCIAQKKQECTDYCTGKKAQRPGWKSFVHDDKSDQEKSTDKTRKQYLKDVRQKWIHEKSLNAIFFIVKNIFFLKISMRTHIFFQYLDKKDAQTNKSASCGY